jgi:hypothetical protein
MQPLMQWKSNEYYVFVVYICSLKYLAYKTHAPFCIVICGQSNSTIFFSHYLMNGTIFRGRGGGGRGLYIFKIKCVFWVSLQLLSETFFILRITERDVIKDKMYIHLHVKYPLFLSYLNETWLFFDRFSKNTSQISWKSVQWGPSCSMWADGQTDRYTWRS